jgi:GH43 family beta-xylosidase
MGMSIESTISLMPNPIRQTFRNPLSSPEGPDPWLKFHDGFYYLAVTRGEFISLRKAASLLDLPEAEEVVIWRDDTPDRYTMMWAPEWFWLDGPHGRRWYCYYTASDDDHMNHRCYVLESSGPDIMGPYHFAGKLLTDPKDVLYAIDGSVLDLPDGRRYFFWAGSPDHRLFVSAMENPWTLTGSRTYLEADGFGCEEVREGPVCLRRNGKIFLVYSTCDTGKPDYKLGMLIADEKDDLLNPDSWRQYPRPVFTRNDAAGVYGPGHHTFFQSPDGTEDWICYHAKDVVHYTYDGRSTRVQPFFWREDGIPDFDVPLSLETEIPLPSGDPKA